MKTALGKAAATGSVASVGVDTWGVDFAFLGEADELLGNPRHYRDPHTEPTMDEAFAQLPAKDLFDQTGIQFMRFNSLFQLLALKKAKSSMLTEAKKLVFMPDLFHCWLCGNTANEATIVSTSQCFDPVNQRWAWPVLDHFGLPRHLFGTVIPAGTRLGSILPSLKHELGLSESIPVVAPASHDTAAAVAAVPAQGDDWCYLSSGTWSLMGVELPRPVINETVRAVNLTNEGGVGGTIRFLKNIMGLWLVQECRRSFSRQGTEYGYDELVRLAQEAPPFHSLVDPDDSTFWLPDDMPEALAAFCRRTQQPAPQTPGGFIRCCLESLALRYRWVKEKLESLTGRSIRVLHIVGGGSQNRLLNQFTADATDCLVLAGPTEATALGNVLTQAMGLGLVGSLSQVREIVGQSCELDRYEPKENARWKEPYARFNQIIKP
jgi:rhamnulokinase